MNSPYYDFGGITIHHGDCREMLPTLGHFDLLLTDPPYGLGVKMWRLGRVSKKWSLAGAVDWDDETAGVSDMLHVADKAIVWGGHLMGLPTSRAWLVWNKILRNFTSGTCELAWSNLDCPIDAFDYAHGELANEVKVHPTQKPLPLMQWCIGKAGEVQSIIDPFAGSGTTGLAAKNLGKSAVLIERKEEYCEMAVHRLAQGEMFGPVVMASPVRQETFAF